MMKVQPGLIIRQSTEFSMWCRTFREQQGSQRQFRLWPPKVTGLAKPGADAWEKLTENMPAIPSTVAERIRLGHYVDFSILPPVTGAIRQPPPQLEGGVVALRAENLTRSEMLIPYFPTWFQCYAIWVDVTLSVYPEKQRELLDYGFFSPV